MRGGGHLESEVSLDPSALHDYLHKHIPISSFMGVEVTKAAKDGVNLR